MKNVNVFPLRVLFHRMKVRPSRCRNRAADLQQLLLQQNCFTWLYPRDGPPRMAAVLYML